jgi:hypothetical protein
MTVLAMLLALLAADFRSAVPSTGKLTVSVQAEVAYSWRFENGEMLVAVDGLPAGEFRVEARRRVRGSEIVVGHSGEICRCGAGPIEVSVWPVSGKVLRAGDYPVILFGGLAFEPVGSQLQVAGEGAQFGRFTGRNDDRAPAGGRKPNGRSALRNRNIPGPGANRTTCFRHG